MGTDSALEDTAGIWDVMGMEARALESPTLAPWAEVVPGFGQMTIAHLLALPDQDGWRYEVVEGVLVRVAGSRPKAVRVSTRLFLQLGNSIEAQGLGAITGADAVYDFEHTGQPNTGLIPDIGFYIAAREVLVADDQPYPFAPDLAIEVASPVQDRTAMNAKAQRYLRSGTRLVWVIYPHYLQVDVWRADPGWSSETLGIADSLDGEDVVPGFSYAVAALFQ